MKRGASGIEVVQWLALSLHSEKVLGWIPAQGVSVWSLCLPPVPVRVLPGYSGLPPKYKNKQNWGLRLIGHSKFPVGLNMKVWMVAGV